MVAQCEEEIEHHPKRISLLQHYGGEYKWNGLEFPLETRKIGKFEKNDLGIAVNVLLNSKKGICTVCRSDVN